jgi:hypothetical protein
MKCYEARSTINATPAAVWTVLSDGASWPTWDSGVESVDGAIALGATVRIQSKVSPGRTFPVKVVAMDSPTGLAFSSGMPFGLFRGTRTYELAPRADGSTDFVMREEYTGPMAGLIGKSIPDLAPSFRQFAVGLKRRVESGREA